ncbi:hypothetical protein FRACA_1290013 [Frankia canadensis]|uniref:Uncharacterized protein n=1 Tax=Frankia canadensis TaxID=1836972 RepID=A0A2I2KKG5_9ACTN|nr:hypothetical protein FRACA_1290013 [Frankia canadensis]SOU53450.1 hypothetical protein FRACA_1290013 [Frankia canadensis]
MEQDLRHTLGNVGVWTMAFDVIQDRVRQHLDAGADHVCVQVLTADPAALPVREWRELAPVVRGVAPGA